LTPLSRTYSKKYIEENVSQRSSNGGLKQRRRWYKKEFSINYGFIDGDNLAVIESIYALDKTLSLITNYYEKAFQQYFVKMSPIDKKRVVDLGTGLWSGVKIRLEEV